MQKNQTLVVAQSWDGERVGEFDTRAGQGWVMSPGVAEGQLEFNTPDPVVAVQDKAGKILDTVNLSVAAQKYQLGRPDAIKKQLAHQNYTTIGNYTIVSPMTGQPQDATTQGVAEGSKETKPKKPMTWQQAYAHNDGESFDARQKRITQYEKSKGNTKPKHVDWGTHNKLKEEGVAEGADDIAQAKERLAYLEKIFDTSYEYSDDHSVWRKHNAIRQEMDQLKKLIAQGNKNVSEEAKKGLYYNVNKRKKAGTSRPKGHPLAPSAQDWKDAAKTAKNEGVSEEKTRLDPKCWSGKKIGNPKTKVKGGVRVNNCVPAESVEEDWQKANKKDKTDGMSQKAVNAYRRENPGSKLKTAVTTKPSKLKKGSKAAKRRKSFCARMSGNKGPMKKPNGKPTPKALALRRWNCESIEEMQNLAVIAEQKIALLKQQMFEGEYKDTVDKSKIPAVQRKAQGGDWKVSTKDLEHERSKSPTGAEGLAKAKQRLDMNENLQQLPPEVVDLIKKIAQSDAAPEHKAAIIKSIMAKYQPVKDIAETPKRTAREKFNQGLKRAGFDPDAAAKRLTDLIAKQKAERERFEKENPAVYGAK